MTFVNEGISMLLNGKLDIETFIKQCQVESTLKQVDFIERLYFYA